MLSVPGCSPSSSSCLESQKAPWLPHMLLSRNAGIKSFQCGAAEPGCATWAGWKQPDLPGDQGGWGTVWPPGPAPKLTHCLHPEAAAELPPHRAHRKHRGIYRALRVLSTNSGKNLHSVKNNLLHPELPWELLPQDLFPALSGPQLLEGGCRSFTIEMGCGAFPGLFLSFSAVSSSCVSFHLPPF